MKSFVRQILILVVLAAVAGVGANLVYGLMGKDSGAYARHLQWWPPHYAKATTVEGCEARTARQAVSNGRSVEPRAGAGGVKQGDEPQAPAGEVDSPQPVNEDPVEDNGESTDVQSAPPSPDPPSDYPMLEIAEFIEELEAGSLVIDARRTKAYVAGHVPGAISVPAWEHPGERVNALLEGAAVLEAPTVVYCSESEECEDSIIVCGLLVQAGFLDLRIYRGGFPDWKEKQPGAIATGEEPGEFDPEALKGEAAE